MQCHQKKSWRKNKKLVVSKLLKHTYAQCVSYAKGVVEDKRLEAKAKDATKSEAKAIDSPFEDRPSRGQGRECSRPRPRIQAQVFSKKKAFKNFFRQSPKKGLQKFFSGDRQNLTIQKIMLSLSRRQGNFRRLEASKPKLRTWVLRPKDFKMCLWGFHLWCYVKQYIFSVCDHS